MRQFLRSLTVPCVWLKLPVPLQRGPGIFMTPGFCFQLGRAAGAEGNAAFTGARGVIGGSPFSGARRFRCQALRRQPQQFPAVKSAEFLFEGGGQVLGPGKRFFPFPRFPGNCFRTGSPPACSFRKKHRIPPACVQCLPPGERTVSGPFLPSGHRHLQKQQKRIGNNYIPGGNNPAPGLPVFLGRDHGKKGGYCSFSADVSAAAFSGLLRSVRRSMSM